MGFSFLAPLGRTWAPRGRPPILCRATKPRRVLSTAVGLTVSGRIYKRHFHEAIAGTDIVAMLEHLRRCIGGLFLLIWDRAPTHRAGVVRQYLADHREIKVEWLPPYAPEINPEENCHGNVKQHLRNATPADVRELCRLVDGGFARLRHRRDLILGFFHHAGLTIKQLW